MHIPFCRQACTYCNFHFTTSLRGKEGLLHALERELETETAYLAGAPVETVYFGGGTPSLLQEDEIHRLMESVRRHYPLSPSAEVTLEANPDDIHPAALQAWKAAGVTRLSIGVQSFDEEELRWMNRAHSAGQAHRAIQWSLEAGFRDFSIDLIYGSPLLSDADWKRNVDTALGYGITHLSCYALTLEEKTPLDKLVRTAGTPPPDSDKAAAQFGMLMEWLRAAGYEHYEVSNFALPGFRSRHNSAYWRGIPYLGIGPSAHSYNGAARRWNPAHNRRYETGILAGLPEREEEVLTPEQQRNEAVMIGLRTAEGIEESATDGPQSTDMKRQTSNVNRFIDAGWMVREGGRLRLTDEGMMRADGIAAALFI